MLAPRNKLWSTPREVIEEAIACLKITPEDLVYDIGCGDGRFLVQCCKATGARAIGIDINEERVKEAQNAIEENHLSSSCSVLCGNALEMDFSDARAIFLYLIPRGLRLILPKILNIPRKVRVVTYMSPFQDKPSSNHGEQMESYLPYAFTKKVQVLVGEHVVQYPIFVYETPGHLPPPSPPPPPPTTTTTTAAAAAIVKPPNTVEVNEERKRQVAIDDQKDNALKCGYPSCQKEIFFGQELINCVKCKKCFYCSREHQRLDRKNHRLMCNRNYPGIEAMISPKPVPSSLRVTCELCGLSGIQTTVRTRKYTQMCNPVILHENLQIMHFFCEGCCRGSIGFSMAEVAEKGSNYPCWRFSPPCKCCRQIYEFGELKTDVEYHQCAPDPDDWTCQECANDCGGSDGGNNKCMNMRVLKISDDCWVPGSGKYMNPWWL